MKYIILVLFCLTSSVMWADVIEQVVPEAQAVVAEEQVTLRWRVPVGKTLAYQVHSEISNVMRGELLDQPSEVQMYLLLTGLNEDLLQVHWIQGAVKQFDDGLSFMQRRTLDDLRAREGEVRFVGTVNRSGEWQEGGESAVRLLDVLLRLPRDAKAQGAQWEHPVDLLQVSGDDARRRVSEHDRVVTLTNVQGRKKRKTAEVSYLLSERVSYVAPPKYQRTNLQGEVDAIGEFLVEAGRWRRVEGIISHYGAERGLQESFVVTPTRLKRAWKKLVKDSVYGEAQS